MKKAPTQKVNLTSAHLDNERQEALRKILPEVFNEDKIDWDRLKAVLGETVDFGREKFGFTWSGKSQAIKNVLIPSKATLKPDEKESIKFNESENLFIEGDNLEVLKLLQKSYFEKVKMIYIDPPYNTGGDFVYKDNFASPLQNYLEQTGQKDSEGNSLQTNRETSGRFHSDWLSMMYPRLKLAWNLLRDDGVIFVSIDDNEVHHLRMVMDEVFGSENFVAEFVWHNKRGGGNDARFVATEHEYIVFYAKDKENLDRLFFAHSEDYLERYSEEDEKGRFFWDTFRRKTGKQYYAITCPDGTILDKDENGNPLSWLRSEARFKKDLEEGEVRFVQNKNGWSVHFKQRMPEGKKPRSILSDFGTTSSGNKELIDIFGTDKVFSNPKPSDLVEHLLDIVTSEDDVVLDFFAGSGTTAHAVLKKNSDTGEDRKFILVQLPESIEEDSEAYKKGYRNIADVSKDRIRKVLQGYGNNPKQINGGFKVFKLSESNYVENNFEFDPEKSDEENQTAFEAYLQKAQQKSLFEKANDVDVVYENIVKEGLSLNSDIEELKIGKNTFHKAIDGEKELYVCLDKKLDASAVKELSSDSFKEKTVILLDEALSDSEKANIALNAELKTI